MTLAEILKKTEPFSCLDGDSLSELCTVARRRKFSKDGIVLVQGDPCESLALVIKGDAAVEISNQEGEAIIADLPGEGDLVGAELLFEEVHFPYTVVSCSASEFCFFPKSSILLLIEKNKDFYQAYSRILSRKLLKKDRHIAILSQKTLRQKVGCFIRSICSFPEQTEVVLPASRDLIAKYLAMPRPSFSRELIQMCQDGILEVEGKKIRILDRHKLEQVLFENETERSKDRK